MKDRLYVKPAAAGDAVLDPKDGKPLPPEGASKPDNSYWRRRLADGSVIETAPAAIDAGRAKRVGEETKAAAAKEAATVAAPAAPEPPKPISGAKEKGSNR